MHEVREVRLRVLSNTHRFSIVAVDPLAGTVLDQGEAAAEAGVAARQLRNQTRTDYIPCCSVVVDVCLEVWLDLVTPDGAGAPGETLSLPPPGYADSKNYSIYN